MAKALIIGHTFWDYEDPTVNKKDQTKLALEKSAVKFLYVLKWVSFDKRCRRKVN